jgi:hypothetical protein
MTVKVIAEIATQSKWLQNGLKVDPKANNFHSSIYHFKKKLLAISHASGYENSGQYTTDDIELSSGVNKFTTLGEYLAIQITP